MKLHPDKGGDQNKVGDNYFISYLVPRVTNSL